jgi:hypothetical protein
MLRVQTRSTLKLELTFLRLEAKGREGLLLRWLSRLGLAFRFWKARRFGERMFTYDFTVEDMTVMTSYMYRGHLYIDRVEKI